MDVPRVARLRWRCRRGMRELDQLFAGWLDHHGAAADPATVDAFEALLMVEDSELWAWCMGRGAPERADWQVILGQIRSPAGV
ncbi:MAG: succinate dehydrogenase assembly factor 2 [Pseudomonadota bacterium]|jgi:antitoxin CptB